MVSPSPVLSDATTADLSTPKRTVRHTAKTPKHDHHRTPRMQDDARGDWTSSLWNQGALVNHRVWFRQATPDKAAPSTPKRRELHRLGYHSVIGLKTEASAKGPEHAQAKMMAQVQQWQRQDKLRRAHARRQKKVPDDASTTVRVGCFGFVPSS